MPNWPFTDATGTQRLRKSRTDGGAEVVSVDLASTGTEITGATMPSGGVGLLGWVSAVWKVLSDRLPSAGVAQDRTTAAAPFAFRLSDGANWLGTLPVSGTLAGSVSVSNFPATQAVSGSVTVSSLPAVTLGASAAAIGSVTVSSLPAVTIASGQSVAVTGTFWQTTQPVSAASLPLPTGAATESTLGTASSRLGDISVHLGEPTDSAASSDTDTSATLFGLVKRLLQKLPALSNSKVPVEATVTGTAAISAVSLPLPTNAATDRTLANAPFSFRLSDGTNFISTLSVSLASLPALATGSNTIGSVTQSGNWSVRLQDGSGTALTSTSVGGVQRLNVTLASSGTPGSAAPSVANLYGGSDGTNLRAINVDSSGRLILGPGSTVGGTIAAVSTTFTRPSDTTAYAAQDAVSNSTSSPTILTFSNAARVSGGSGLIVSARHSIKRSSPTASNASFRLWLFRSTVSAVNDNAAFNLNSANRGVCIGYIDFADVLAGSGGDATEGLTTFVNLPFVATGTSLFGQLTATAAYSPASAEEHFVELVISQN